MSAPIVQAGEKDLSKYQFAIMQLGQGRSNAVGTVTLRANETTTTVPAINCGAGNVVVLFQATANAAAVVATTYVPVATVTAGQFIVNHPSSGSTDKTFYWVALG